MSMEKEMTAPVTSVGADAEQSLKKCIDNSIPENEKGFKDSEESFAELQRKVMRMMDPSYLKTVSMSELFDTAYPSRLPIIDGLLYPGTYLFVGAPKLGKSFLMAQLAYHISTGTPLWNFTIREGTVLYLALEDDYKRLQARLYRMFGAEGNENLFFSVSAGQLGNGLDEQLTRFMQEHPDTHLIIIDTLQKIREVGGDRYSYASDYEIITRLKNFADSYGICLLLVHHTRKQQADDKFDMISGTNGLLGAADGAFLLQKEKRTSNNAILEVSGRDQQDQRLYLIRNTDTLAWDLERAETELWKAPPEPLLEAIAKVITVDNSEWIGSPSELVDYLGVDLKANVLTLRLNVNAGRLFEEYGIRYENKRYHDGRQVKLTFERVDA
ncbi:MAG TPA: helicase RepA family protein [Clostridia bacterium]|nr:helicase RepA family protein [Clostridia bacterium]